MDAETCWMLLRTCGTILGCAAMIFASSLLVMGAVHTVLLTVQEIDP